MAQAQITTTDRHLIDSLPADVARRKLVTDGDLVGFAADDGAENDRLIVWLRTIQYSTQVLKEEAWIPGELLYYHPLANIVTRLATDWPMGWAESAKKGGSSGDTGGYVASFTPRRQAGRVLMPFDWAKMLDLGTDGDLVLRDFSQTGGADKLVTAARIIHDAALSPGAATISLGDGTGSNDQILAATPLSGLAADGEHVVDLATGGAVPLDKVVLHIASGPITDGLLTVDLEYSDLA